MTGSAGAAPNRRASAIADIFDLVTVAESRFVLKLMGRFQLLQRLLCGEQRSFWNMNCPLCGS